MNRVWIFLVIILSFISCSEDEFSMEPSSLKSVASAQFDEQSVDGCFDAEIVNYTERGCCMYTITYRPKSKVNNAYLKIDGALRPYDSYLNYSFIWNIEVCNATTVQLLFEKKNETILGCTEILDCTPDCCDACLKATNLGESSVLKGCYNYKIEVLGANPNCEWDIEGVLSNLGGTLWSGHDIGTDFSNTALVTVCHSDPFDQELRFIITAENINSDCDIFYPGYIYPNRPYNDNPNYCHDDEL